MTYLVTGGAGFIGSHVADAFIESGHRVVVVDNLVTGKRSNINSKAIFIRMDIQDKRLASVFKKYRPAIVSHHAAQMDVRRSVADPLFDAKTNILGTLNLLECSRQFGVKKFIFASSGGTVYGETKKIPTRETHQTHPISPYGVAKLTGEQYCYYYWKQYGLPYVSLRYANVYGPRQRGDGEAGVVAIFIEKILQGEKPVINGDGKQTRDFVFVGDVVRANIVAARKNIVGTINIGTGKETNINVLFQKIAQCLGVPAKERHGKAKPGEQRRSALQNTYAQKTVGWWPLMDFDEGLKKTVIYFSSAIPRP